MEGKKQKINYIESINKHYFGSMNKKHDENKLEFLLSEDLLFKTESNVLFDNLSLFFETPYILDNIIIDINATSNHDYNKISNELQYLGCPNILFRFYDKI